MAFRDFTFPQVEQDLGLHWKEADLFSSTPTAAVRAGTAELIREGTELAQAISTEKAKSEFIIAPVLLELRHLMGGRIAVFSGIEWDVDAERGLNGYCDFILTRGGSQLILRSPFVAIVEAKNDLIRTGLGQCVAAMVAARICNERAGESPRPVFGVVSTGAIWKFLRLDGNELTADRPEYFIDNLPKVMGILKAMVESP